MSGSFISTGLLTNDGEKKLFIDSYLFKKIKDLTIHVIPLSLNHKFRKFQIVSYFAKMVTPMIFNPSLVHVALQLNMEDSDDVIIIEYGQYLSENSELKNSNNLFSSNSSNSSNEPRTNKNPNIYYYINKDGARLTLIKYEDLDDYHRKGKEDLSMGVSDFIACQYYNVSYLEFRDKVFERVLFQRVDCNIKNKITIKELIKNFEDEKWEAEKYNVLTHNCQTFAAEIIKILKAIRRDETDKYRCIEKGILPGCIISALWHNEDLSLTNTLGRIPIFGFFHDYIRLNWK